MRTIYFDAQQAPNVMSMISMNDANVQTLLLMAFLLIVTERKEEGAEEK